MPEACGWPRAYDGRRSVFLCVSYSFRAGFLRVLPLGFSEHLVSFLPMDWVVFENETAGCPLFLEFKCKGTKGYRPVKGNASFTSLCTSVRTWCRGNASEAHPSEWKGMPRLEKGLTIIDGMVKHYGRKG